VVVFAKGLHRCPHESCIEKNPFKRQEHLKRHLNTLGSPTSIEKFGIH
jgi:hypothetical protein